MPALSPSRAANDSPVTAQPDAFASPDRFETRHIGPSDADLKAMLSELGYPTLDGLMDAAVPKAIRLAAAPALPAPASEQQALAELAALAAKNKLWRSYIGCGYYGTLTPGVIARNILENPGWYTQYTPYQPEISQGRLEALLNFQTMVCDLTGLDVANASLLDEATAAAEAMNLAFSAKGSPERRVFFADADAHPQTLAVLRTRAEPLGIEVAVARADAFDYSRKPFGVLLQTPASDGAVRDHAPAAAAAHRNDAFVVMATDLLALTLFKSPGEMGADCAVGSAQRFGVPLGYGGPHAAFMAVKDAYKRQMPGRLIGVSKDAKGRPALRLSLQTREQHIRREKATSNICTAQVLLAVMASMYAVYHGPKGLSAEAGRIRRMTLALAAALRALGWRLPDSDLFDTLKLSGDARKLADARARAEQKEINLRLYEDGSLGLSLDETVTTADLADLLWVFGGQGTPAPADAPVPPALSRGKAFLTHPVFNSYHSEHEMLRYIRRLEAKDLSLTTSMIPLGSCTMKLNATSEMLPVSWPAFSRLHPYAPAEQAAGYAELFRQLESWLCAVTGFAAVSLQPNAGSQGEYAGLLAIRAYHRSRGQGARGVCLIPQSAHGTNPASAAMAGMRIVVVACDAQGNIDLGDLAAQAKEHAAALAALMVTYPSTHGVYEAGIKDVCRIVHENGGQVYMDGANLNAQVGWTRPGDIGADVCHMNLHKTFCIPHGGGGPGVGPIGVAAHLAPFLPGHPLRKPGAAGAVSAAPWGSASILPIPWMYIRMMGGTGLARATAAAILNANYVAKKLDASYPVLYKGAGGLVAHECILDLRGIKAVSVDDVAKRLMDFGFHAPTMSFPVTGTLMIEPTESESKEELDRFIEAMRKIRAEIADIESGKADKADNPLKNAPLTAQEACADSWTHPYSREAAAYPAPWLKRHKYWPSVGRVDAPYGDRNLVCSCPPPESYA
ncbi:MAG: aminomethyl-transferring glycine dehydrogenase [Elusimicrobia bacterium]|nr:aminomethyl-transferring glycine dehydrogenase [Elusimicrobiota bacterium]